MFFGFFHFWLSWCNMRLFIKMIWRNFWTTQKMILLYCGMRKFLDNPKMKNILCVYWGTKMFSSLFYFIRNFFRPSDEEKKENEIRRTIEMKGKFKNIVKNANGNTVVKGTKLVVCDSKIVIGKEEGREIVSLSNDDILLCKKKKFAYVTKKNRDGGILVIPLTDYDMSFFS
jgi:hypothetical protein